MAELLKSVGVHSPTIIASLVLAIAAMLKFGKEKGALVVLLGAGGLLLMSILSPIIYLGVMPRVIEGADSEAIPLIYFTVNLLLNLVWAVAVILIAVGIMLRPPAGPSTDRPG